jgi:chaperonin GroEL
VGGATQTEIQARKDLAERAAEAIRGAMLKGVLPGGGAAFLACRPALQAALKQAQDPDEIAAMRILIRAMEAPLRAIAANAGLLPDEVMAELKMAGPGCAYDVRKRQVVAFGGPDDPAALLDSASAVQSAGYRAIAGAALLLTVDVLVRHKKPEQMINP